MSSEEKNAGNGKRGKMTITAKYASRCSICGGKIAVGESIEWVKGSSDVHHTHCPTQPVKADQPAYDGRTMMHVSCLPSIGSMMDVSGSDVVVVSIGKQFRADEATDMGYPTKDVAYVYYRKATDSDYTPDMIAARAAAAADRLATIDAAKADKAAKLADAKARLADADAAYAAANAAARDAREKYEQTKERADYVAICEADRKADDCWRKKSAILDEIKAL